MSTTIVRPRDTALAAALCLAAIFAAATFLFHIAANLWQAHIGYGYFRDEFYYIACGRHLAWGYVDHGPLVAVQARLAETLFGHSLTGLRLLAGLAGAGRVLLTGLLAWSLGGRRPAQALAMFGVALAPQYLALDGFLSMNCAESLFWMTCLLVLIQMLCGGSPWLWLVFGASAGLGLLNKPSMTFFLIALLAALLLTPQRRLLSTWWAAAGTVLLLLIVLPNLLWQIHNGWPTWEFLHNDRVIHKNKSLGPAEFLFTQILSLEPASALIWITGLVFLLRRKQWRFLGLTYLFFLAGMMVLHAKDYYVAPIYPILFAAGGLAWETRFAAREQVRSGHAFAFLYAIATLALISIAVLPMSTPILTPTAWIAYAKATHLFNAASNSENAATGPLPQFYADRFGWQEEVDQITAAVRRLSPEDRARAGILADNYGEAGALDFLGHDLPRVIAGHNNYWLWGPRQVGGGVLIVISGDPVEHFTQLCRDVRIIGHNGHPLGMPHERKNIFLLHDCQEIQSPAQNWARYKHFE